MVWKRSAGFGAVILSINDLSGSGTPLVSSGSFFFWTTSIGFAPMSGGFPRKFASKSAPRE